jgi:hypothetical protein
MGEDKKFFAGIGSRSTPKDHLYLLRDACKYLAERNWILRSGGADGADAYCERGCNMGLGKKEIYLPWKNFNDNHSELYPDNLPDFYKAMEIAAKYHPTWYRLREPVKLLMARNSYQIGLDNYSSFVLCYCPIENGEWIGGTGQALRYASDLGIKIINIFNEKDKRKIEKKIYREI